MKITLSKKTKFIAANAVQLGIILIIIVVKLMILGSGTEIFLHIQPIDPRDPLRGDYLTFRYDITNLSYYNYTPVPYGSRGGTYLKNGDTVYVPLYKSGKYWTGSEPRVLPPDDPNTLYIKGTVISGGRDDSYLPDNSNYYNQEQQLVIRYGIEDYFIPENTGRSMPIGIGQNNAYADIVVDEKGNAVLKKVFINDKPWPQ